MYNKDKQDTLKCLYSIIAELTIFDLLHVNKHNI